jgi:hypothetical protein
MADHSKVGRRGFLGRLLGAAAVPAVFSYPKRGKGKNAVPGPGEWEKGLPEGPGGATPDPPAQQPLEGVRDVGLFPETLEGRRRLMDYLLKKSYHARRLTGEWDHDQGVCLMPRDVRVGKFAIVTPCAPQVLVRNRVCMKEPQSIYGHGPNAVDWDWAEMRQKPYLIACGDCDVWGDGSHIMMESREYSPELREGLANVVALIGRHPKTGRDCLIASAVHWWGPWTASRDTVSGELGTVHVPKFAVARVVNSLVGLDGYRVQGDAQPVLDAYFPEQREECAQYRRLYTNPWPQSGLSFPYTIWTSVTDDHT